MSDVSKARLAPDADETPRANPDPTVSPGGEDRPTPGDQERPLTRDERRDEALDETFPASDPVPPSRIDGPND